MKRFHYFECKHDYESNLAYYVRVVEMYNLTTVLKS